MESDTQDTRNQIGSLSGLAAELRNLIYKLSFTDGEQSLAFHYSTKPLHDDDAAQGLTIINTKGISSTAPDSENNKALLRTYSGMCGASPQLHEEATAVFFDNVSFRFLDYQHPRSQDRRVAGFDEVLRKIQHFSVEYSLTMTLGYRSLVEVHTKRANGGLVYSVGLVNSVEKDMMLSTLREELAAVAVPAVLASADLSKGMTWQTLKKVLQVCRFRVVDDTVEAVDSADDDDDDEDDSEDQVDSGRKVVPYYEDSPEEKDQDVDGVAERMSGIHTKIYLKSLKSMGLGRG
ncbi:hypothetical protein LTR36_004870 [Oleoguttula mirabilis]|uniref:Uncharacterized protein n=1 Tax=Oleoguttula mirabilis TaxID=1507867 RepID=A0AAV9JFC6_9PEZI|nr:hypothetical protein LTR36_004870 [Oleoguttula mirabilis]